jgi:hypothetical protein
MAALAMSFRCRVSMEVSVEACPLNEDSASYYWKHAAGYGAVGTTGVVLFWCC